MMRKLLVCFSLVLVSFAHAQTYTSIHTLGKPPVIKNKGTGILDLTDLIKSNPHLTFAVKDPKSGEISYTRNSLFYGKNDGFYYQGQKRLQGYPVPTEITSNDCELTDIKSPPEEIPATATTTIEFLGNLNSGDAVPAATFDPANPSTYNFLNVTNQVYDSLGSQHQLSVYFIKNSANTWSINVFVDASCIGSGNLIFNNVGSLVSETGMDSLIFIPTMGAKSPQILRLQFTGFTQYGNQDHADMPISDGMSAGIYSSFMVDNNGYISFNYSNGQSITFSKVAVFNQ